jgi:anti-sigma regulatory factor (Ser/Thr protein kinase)
MQPTNDLAVEWWMGQIAKGAAGEQFEGPNFMKPYHFAVLANAAYRMGASKLAIPQKLEQYAARMRLWQAIGLECPQTVVERNPGGRFFPLAPITSENSAEDAADGIRDVFEMCGTTDQATLRAIGIMLSEILGNCFFHSEMSDNICGLACAQSWPATNLAQVAVADTGLGIRATLGRNPAYADRLRVENANALATELGVTGKPEGRHSGYGLAVARQLMQNHGGSLIVLSGDEAFRATGQTVRVRKLLHSWQGTIVIMEWRTDRPLDVSAVYAAWPHTDEASDVFL